MADTKISAESAAAALGGTEKIPGVQSAANVYLTPAQIKTFASASPTLVTPDIGVAIGTSLDVSGLSKGAFVQGTSYVTAPTIIQNTDGGSIVLGALSDVSISRGGVNQMDVGAGVNAQKTGVYSLTELTTIAAAATTDTTILLPAAAIILAVSVRVTVALPITTNFTVGDAGSAARYSTAAVAKAVNSTDPGTKAGAYYNAAATAVRITPNSTPSDATGRVRVTIHYISITPPTS